MNEIVNRRSLAIALAAVGTVALIENVEAANVKISAFPNASANMAPTGDKVTGLQGGANVNFTQTQILTGQTGTYGQLIQLKGGAGTAGYGGGVNIAGGNAGGAGNYIGGYVGIFGGRATGNAKGGNVYIGGGDGLMGGNATVQGATVGSSGYGGALYLKGGSSSSGPAGSVYIQSGTSLGNQAGNLKLSIGSGMTPGFLYIFGIPTSGAGLPTGAIYSSTGTLKIK